jgi:hypothetical protein
MNFSCPSLSEKFQYIYLGETQNFVANDIFVDNVVPQFSNCHTACL